MYIERFTQILDQIQRTTQTKRDKQKKRCKRWLERGRDRESVSIILHCPYIMNEWKKPEWVTPEKVVPAVSELTNHRLVWIVRKHRDVLMVCSYIHLHGKCRPNGLTQSGRR